MKYYKLLQEVTSDVAKAKKYSEYIKRMDAMNKVWISFAASNETITVDQLTSLMTLLNLIEDNMDFLLREPEFIRDIDPHWSWVINELNKTNSIR